MLKNIRRPQSEDYDIGQVTAINTFSVAIDNSTWTAISLPAGVKCESILVKCRAATNKFYVSSYAVPGENYISIEAGDSTTVDIDLTKGATFCYIKGTVASDRVECITSA